MLPMFGEYAVVFAILFYKCFTPREHFGPLDSLHTLVNVHQSLLLQMITGSMTQGAFCALLFVAISVRRLELWSSHVQSI